MAPKLSPEEVAHARSITDSNVILAPTPPAWKPKVLIASVIRKPAAVVAAFLHCLSWQRLKRESTISYSFITDFPAHDPEAPVVKDMLQQFAAQFPNVTVAHNAAPDGDYGDAATTRHWTPPAMHRVGELKNRFFQQCMTQQQDAVWLVDADVLCDPTTLQSLLDTECPIVAGVYWTHWNKPQPGDTAAVHAGPQVWLRHPYQLSGHGYSEADFRQALVARKLLRVWGLGACTLFSRAVLEKGVSFTPVPEGLPPGPMSDGEDRHLCERARRLHIPLYADPWPDIFHAYHASDYADLAKWIDRFAQARPERPQAETLVSFKVETLEPVPHPTLPGLIQHVGPQYVRGRLATLPVLPELAEALGSMRAGERRLVTLHYPGHYPFASLRHQRRLVSLSLLDLKPWRFAPVIGEELFAGGASWKVIDSTTLTSAQITSLEEEAHAVAD